MNVSDSTAICGVVHSALSANNLFDFFFFFK